MILDAHTHAVDWDEPAHSPVSFATYLHRARAAGIGGSVVFSGFAEDYAPRNRDVAALVARHPGRLIGFCFVHARRDAGNVHGIVEHAIGELDMRGIKVHRKDAPLTDEICDAAQVFGLPILYDPDGEVDVAADFAARHPEVPFIVPHLGTFNDRWERQLALIDHLERLPNLHTDTSGVRSFDLLVEAVARAGASKVLFGSDGPWLHPAVELAKVRLLRLRPDQEGLILGGNLRRILSHSTWPRPRIASRVPSAAHGR